MRHLAAILCLFTAQAQEKPTTHTSVTITATTIEPSIDNRNSEVFTQTLFSRDDQVFHQLNGGINAGQHEGGGKSIEIRRFGFNLDHGGVSGGLKVLVDNIQQNQSTQGHGQGYLDPSQGGRIRNGTLAGYFQQLTTNGDSCKVDAFLTRSLFDFYSNFTYFLNDPENGEAIQQHDSRRIERTNLQYKHATQNTTLTAGINFHDNQINVGLTTRVNAHVTNAASTPSASTSKIVRIHSTPTPTSPNSASPQNSTGSLEFLVPSRTYGCEAKSSFALTRSLSVNGGLTKVSNAFYCDTTPRRYVDRAPTSLPTPHSPWRPSKAGQPPSA